VICLGGINRPNQPAKLLSNRAPSLATSFAGAYPGFMDFYQQGGWGNTLFIINHNGTATLQNSLNLAKSSGSAYLQLITWNDYGEGTMIEPTLDFNFTFLQTIQQYTGVAYTVTELQLIYSGYTLRKKYKGNIAVEAQLTLAFNYLISLDVTNATTIISPFKTKIEFLFAGKVIYCFFFSTL